jgi:CubicO group peptidase (beta-lactamase class C family)
MKNTERHTHRCWVRMILPCTIAFALASSVAVAEQVFSLRDLVGLWCAKKTFGPEIRGELTISKDSGMWMASIADRSVQVTVSRSEFRFELPDELGAFRGRFDSDRFLGHWIQPRTMQNGTSYATPVNFERVKEGRWRGFVDPKEDAMTFYLPIQMTPAGTLSAYLRNPECNLGRFINVQHLTCDGHSVKLLGFRTPSDSSEIVLLTGSYDADRGVISVYIPQRGGTYDFERASAADAGRFYPRGKPTTKYTYVRPSSEDDGWAVGSLDEVGISRDSIENFVQMLIDMPMESVHTSEVHGFLLARHGKLVLEEYFHGFHSEALHDTRSAAKSLTSMLTGAAVLRGYPVSLASPVYETLYGTTEAALIDPRKRAITVQNLLTMSSGLDCDDSDPNSKGSEDVMQDQSDQPDWYRYTLDRDMVRNPGERAVYGSANANLMGGILAKTTQHWLPDLFRDLIAGPLQITHYAINLTPTFQAYMGGGAQLRLRDFMKLAQVMIDGGLWHGKQIVSSDWVKQSTRPLYEMGGTGYGFLWWITDYPYQSRRVGAFFAAGNGGQVVIGIPELDIVVAFFGGNYSDRVSYVPQQVFVPKYVLPAVN